MARIDFNQLDDFDLTGIKHGDILVYNAVTENLEPVSFIVFRRAFLLMGA